MAQGAQQVAGAAPAGRLSAKVVAGAVLRLLFLPVAFLLPAGTLAWVEGWIVVAVYLVWAVVVLAWLARHDRSLLMERMNVSPVRKGQASWDKVLSVIMIPLGLAVILVPPLDHRWSWSDVPVWLEAIGMAVHVPALALVLRVMAENTYLSRVVKVDAARGHRVITTGPYRVIRHPMYAAVIPLLLALPLALGSWVGLAPAGALVALVVLRTVLEDRALMRDLPGYVEYATRTRFRLVPGLF